MRHSDEESLSFYAVLTCYVLPMCCVIAASVATLQLLGSCVHMADSGPTDTSNVLFTCTFFKFQ